MGLVPSAGASDAGATSESDLADGVGGLTARGPGAGDMRDGSSELLNTMTRAGGAVVTLVLVLVLLRLFISLRWPESDEDRRKGEDTPRHKQAGMRVPLLRSALRMVSRACAGLESVAQAGKQQLVRFRWVAAPKVADERAAEKLHGTPERVESGTVGVPSRTPAAETEMCEMSVSSGLPKLLGSTSDPPSVLSSAQVALVHRALPPRIRIRDWVLLYSTEQHGCSLRTAYHRTEWQGPTVLLVLDGQGSIFGAFSGDSWRDVGGKHYHGNGETFLFKVHPEFEVYNWTRANDHFVLASHDCLAFGSEDAGIYLDSAFEFGSSKRSLTFDNEPLGSSIDFKCIKVEIWAFK